MTLPDQIPRSFASGPSRYTRIVINKSAFNVVTEADVKFADSVAQNVNAIVCRHRAKKLVGGWDLNPRSGSCRIMSHPVKRKLVAGVGFEPTAFRL